MQVAAMAPIYLDESEIVADDTRPVAQVSLLQQPFIKDNSSSVGDMVQELAAKMGENVRVLRFTRLALGE
jgi:elongation factor Ts